METQVAVLIPSYQPKEYFEKCLNALETQTLSKEKYCVYIVLNGTGYPYEEQILELLKNYNFKYCYQYIKARGVSIARNKLIEISREPFIVFIDDDDLISANYLENLLNVSTSDLMGISNIFTFKDDLKNLKENYMSKVFPHLIDGEISLYKTRKYFSSPCAKMLHRDMIAHFKYDFNIEKGEDSLFMAMISKKICGIRKTSLDTCYYVFERENSASRKIRRRYEELGTLSYVLKKYFGLLVSKEYNKFFILTRIVATCKKIFRVIQG